MAQEYDPVTLAELILPSGQKHETTGTRMQANDEESSIVHI